MKLLNYTTDVPVHKTISEIQQELLRAHATAIAMEYDTNGAITSIFFRVKRPDGTELPFRLPAKANEVYDRLFADKPGENKWGGGRREKSRMIAWRIVLTWLKAQVALLELEMVRSEEVFLPYLMVNATQTLFESMEQKGFLLPSPKDEN